MYQKVNDENKENSLKKLSISDEFKDSNSKETNLLVLFFQSTLYIEQPEEGLRSETSKKQQNVT